MSTRGEVLVVIMNSRADWAIACDRHWYRIPNEQVEKLKQRNQWLPPKWIAFYQTKVFGKKKGCAISFCSEVTAIRQVSRSELFPEEVKNAKSEKLYYKLEFDELQSLVNPIPSQRLRRITFIPTTWTKFIQAKEINDLWNESPLEDALWQELKNNGIPAERQENVKVKENHYILDFVIYCRNGTIDVETDGDTFHTDRQQVTQDNIRENDLKTMGWCTLRFNTQQVKEAMAEYCIPTIAANINRLGGLEDVVLQESLGESQPEVTHQLPLFIFPSIKLPRGSSSKQKRLARKQNRTNASNFRQLKLF